MIADGHQHEASLLVTHMVTAAKMWLASLHHDQRPMAALGIPLPGTTSNADRLRWYYTPTDHGGLALNQQSPRQQRLSFRLLASGLSEMGYVTAATIIGLENVLDREEAWTVDWGRERGRDPGLYYLRVFGEPGGQVWAWRLAGHHLSINYLVVNDVIAACTPCFMGADPAVAPLPGSAYLRPLGRTEALAHELITSMSSSQLQRAVISDRAVSDIVSGNRFRLRDGDTMMHMQDLWRQPFEEQSLIDRVDAIDHIAEAGSGYDDNDHARVALTDHPKGIPATVMDVSQQRLLTDLVETFIGRAPTDIASEHRARIASPAGQSGGVHFAWAGQLTEGEPIYFRLQGEDFLAEYNNTQRGANHAHSVWRSPKSDFGLAALSDLNISGA